MITDPRVFDDDHLPRALLHRESEVDQLCRALEPALDGRPDDVDDVLLSGPSGVGKTALTRHTLARLEERADTRHAHVRCLGQTTGGVLRAILDAHPGDRADVSRTTPVDELHDAIRAAVDGHFVAILDEAEGVLETRAIELLDDVPGLSMVVVCHDPERWLARLPNTDGGRFAAIALDRYRVDALADILDARADAGLRRGAVDRAQLERIADESAGIARRAVQALRAACELATERDHGSVQDGDVDDSFERARRRIRASNLRSLPLHHQVLYAIVQEAGEIDASELHARYDEVAGRLYHGRELTPIGRRARRNKLAKLREYDLLIARGPAHARRYAATDDSIEAGVSLADAAAGNPSPLF